MRGLTLWRPWDEPVAVGEKPVENRDWPPPQWMIGKLLAIHAGKTYDAAGAEFCRDMGFQLLPRAESDHRAGHIVAVVTLARACRREDRPGVEPRGFGNGGSVAEILRSRWFFGEWGWLFTHATPIEPVPCRGAQGLWPVPADVLPKVQAAYNKARLEAR